MSTTFTLLEIMERAGMEDPTLASAWIKDALYDIQQEGSIENYKAKESLVADQRYYNFPSDMVELQAVYYYDTESGEYVPMKRAIDMMIADPDEDIGTGDVSDTNTYIFILD